MKIKKLPSKIQFSFKDLSASKDIDIPFKLEVYLGEKIFDGEPIEYTAILNFYKAGANSYKFGGINELIDQHDIRPYDHIELDKKLESRIIELLENCSLDVNKPLKVQLETFLTEYGDNKLLRFYL